MKALDGVTVIDFTQTYSGPFCTMQLADFGAKVIKIERIHSGDSSRDWEPMKNGHSGYFASINRNKESISVDMKTEEGLEVIKRLIMEADILVECFKPGTMSKMGIGYDDVIHYKPDIIYASLSGYGQYGPLSKEPAYDNIIQSMSGLMDMTGFPDGEPVKVGVSVGDSLAGLNTSLGILMAYFHKLNTGEGQMIDVAMLDSVFGIMESPVLFQSLLGKELSRSGNNDSETLVPYDVYACQDGYFSVGLAGESGWGKFTEVMNKPGLLKDPRFRSNGDRCRNYNELNSVLEEFFADRTKAELEDLFTNAGIPNAPVLSVPETISLSHLKDRNMIVSIQDSGIGHYDAIGNPMKMDITPPTYEKGAPLIGENTEEIMEMLGYTAHQIEEMKVTGVIE